jgi:hypothetical protein
MIWELRKSLDCPSVAAAASRPNSQRIRVPAGRHARTASALSATAADGGGNVISQARAIARRSLAHEQTSCRGRRARGAPGSLVARCGCANRRATSGAGGSLRLCKQAGHNRRGWLAAAVQTGGPHQARVARCGCANRRATSCAGGSLRLCKHAGHIRCGWLAALGSAGLDPLDPLDPLDYALSRMC